MTNSGMLLALAVVLCPACGSNPYLIHGPSGDVRTDDITNDSLALRGAVMVRNDPYRLMRVEITAINRLDRAVTLTVPGGCPVAFQVLTAAPPGGRIAWDSRYASSSLGCVLSTVQIRIAPRESKVFVRELERAGVLGDSLVAGSYYVRAQLDL